MTNVYIIKTRQIEVLRSVLALQEVQVEVAVWGMQLVAFVLDVRADDG